MTKGNRPSAPSPQPPAPYRYGMLCLAVGLQLATVLLAWPIWGVRQQPPNVPLFDLPQFSFALPILFSLTLPLIWPRAGVWIHLAVLTISCIWDQYRLQPQLLSLVVLMGACASDGGSWFARWYLAAMWIWAGLHKFLSMEWFGSSSWTFLAECGIHPDGRHFYFAIAVAIVELGLGITAALWPKRAAVGCLLMHLGILASLSPLGRDFNISVWPWNLGTAVIGFWLLRRDVIPPWSPPLVTWRYARALRFGIVGALLLAPAGFYLDLVNPHLAFVLYSGNMPRAFHTSSDGARRLDGWTGLTVPFPDSPWLFQQTFRQTAKTGDKLFIGDPRWGFPNGYFTMASGGKVRELTREQFLNAGSFSGEVAGIEVESEASVWRLKRLGMTLERNEIGFVTSATITGRSFDDESIAALAELPNLKELKIQRVPITDSSLAVVSELPHLEIIILEQCPVTDEGVARLAGAPKLVWLHLEDTKITNAAMPVLGKLSRLEVLRLKSSDIDDEGLVSLAPLTKLTWLDLSDTNVTGSGLEGLHLPQCEWLNLSRTKIADDQLRHLSRAPKLEVLELDETAISERGLVHLQALKNLQNLSLEGTFVTDAAVDALRSFTTLQQLSVRGTRLTPDGIRRLSQALPQCRIDY